MIAEALGTGVHERVRPCVTSMPPHAPKFAPPTTSPDVVDRPRLVERLCDRSARVVLNTAPAGYGKSTLMAQWSAVDDRPFGWVAIDAADNDPVVFLISLALALDGIETIDDALMYALVAADGEWTAQLIAGITDVVVRREIPFVLVLDNLQVLDGPSRDVLLPALAAHVPPGSTLALLTRTRLPLPTSRATLGGHVHGLDARDLAMTETEASALLAGSGLHLDAELVALLTERTEGWPAGLCIAASSLCGADDLADAVSRFTGSDRFITDFLMEEVLRALPHHEAEFLLACSPLGQLSGPLCDRVLDRQGSGELLERLARDNGFVVPLDRNGSWYRYHHLFGEMLRVAMQRNDAQAYERNALRASTWFEEHDDVDRAITHALSGNDLERAATLVWQSSPSKCGADRIATVGCWLDRFPAGAIEHRPELAVTAAWHALAIGDVPAVHRFTATAELQPPGAVLPDGSEVEAAVSLLRAMTLGRGLEHVRDAAACAFVGLAESSPYRAIARYVEGVARALLDDASARDLLEEGARIGSVLLPHAQAWCLGELARLAAAAGDRREAEMLVDHGLRVVREFGLEEHPASSVVYATAAAVHAVGGATDRARDECHRGIELIQRLEDLSSYPVVSAYLELTMASTLVGDIDAAMRLLDEAERRVRRLPDARALPGRLERVRQTFEDATAASGTLAVALSPAELRVLQWLPTHLSFGEIGDELFVSRNTVKSHVMAIYRKLGVTSRGSAVLAARTLGLVADEQQRS